MIVALLGCLLLLQAQLWTQDGGLRHMWQLRASVDAQIDENETLQTRNAALEADVDDLKSGLDALEERARSELGMIREGEVFYQVAEP
ncbi:cell division protein FtsB [Natronocella acetinitrilica]|uniref:Cell division protein FtsB n=2 Tax=Natronocella acetinitrilica TaxID=414046 RepID=A0AAE3G5H5_9GAMM|nr:cell division protein FtsB [Natronocella acetinitrilica]